MTRLYHLSSVPSRVEIRCPRCDAPAVFRFAACLGFVDSKKRRAEIEEHPAYDLELVVGWGNNHRRYAIYYPELDRERVSPFTQGRSGLRRFGDRGTCRCATCGYRQRHLLKWPDEAVFSCWVRGKHLWAWNREHAQSLREFVGSTNRSYRGRQHRLFLMRIPTHFLKAKRRGEVVKKLDRLLAG